MIRNKSECKIICVLEDLVLIEYNGESNISKKMMTFFKWLETDKINEIISLKNFDE